MVSPAQGVSLLLMLVLWHYGPAVGQRIVESQCELEAPVCSACGPLVSVTVVARNVLRSPIFELMVSLRLRQVALLLVLEQAAGVVGGFRFKSTYLPVVGYYIEVINGLEGSAENHTFWHLVSHNRGALPCGVSRYIPGDGEIILFNFTTYEAAGYLP